MRLTRRSVVGAGAWLAGAGAAAAATPPGVTRRAWDRLADGRPVSLYTLSDGRMTAQVSDFGALLVGFATPDRHGRMGDIVLGFDRVAPYAGDTPMFGAVVGRYANRIARGRFTLDGRAYQLALNDNGKNSIHGGWNGWNKAMWTARPLPGPEPALELTLRSPDGDQGFPGAVDVRLTYRITRGGRLALEAHATTDAPTVVNMTDHSYFNLAADPRHLVLDTEMRIRADRYTVFDDTAVPTGEIASVAGTPLDFRQAKPVGRDLPPQGYNHNYVLDPPEPGQALRRAAWARDPGSGRTLEMFTDQPGLQLYTAHYLHTTGRGGVFCGPSSGFCWEAQHFPDSPNHPDFPSTVLRPGERFTWRCEYLPGVA